MSNSPTDDINVPGQHQYPPAPEFPSLTQLISDVTAMTNDTPADTPEAAGAHGNQSPQASQDGRTSIAESGYQPGPHGADHSFIRLFFPSAKANNEEQAEFLLNVRAVIQCLPPGYSADEFLATLREHLPPAALFHPNVLRFKMFHRRLRDYMVEKAGVSVKPMCTGRERRIDMQLARTIYDGDDFSEELEIALNLIGVHKNWDPSRNPAVPVLAPHMIGTPSSTTGAVGPRDEFRSPPSGKNFFDQYDRTYIDLSKSFTHSSKYGGDISETFQDFVYAYENVVENCHLPDDKKKDYLSLILRGDAARFFSQHVKLLARSYDEAKRMIQDHFHGPAQQQRVVAYLQSLRFDQFISDGTSPNDALNKLASTIKAHFPNTPRDWQTQYNKIQVMYDAVAAHDWSRSAIEAVHIEIKTFEAFHAKLANSLQKRLRLETINGTPPLVIPERAIRPHRASTSTKGATPTTNPANFPARAFPPRNAS